MHCMIGDAFHSVVYEPLYNALIWILSHASWIDVGLAVIALTVLVKLILFPLSLKAARTQRLMKELEEPMKEIREKYKDRQEQGRAMLELYRERQVNPFSGFVVLFIQLPVILGLYFVFLNGGLPEIKLDELYSWVRAPESVNMLFLGIVDMAGKSHVLALFAGVTQYFQAKLAMPPLKPRDENATFQEDFARTLQLQMKYVLPFVIVVVAYIASAAVALYWITSNIFAIGQELYVKRTLDKEKSQTDDN
jgi:YidC/Oxa1 family membrane protein insertase